MSVTFFFWKKSSIVLYLRQIDDEFFLYLGKGYLKLLLFFENLVEPICKTQAAWDFLVCVVEFLSNKCISLRITELLKLYIF
jgi:hypothetical protein